MPSHWVKKGDQLKVPTKYSAIETVGDVDTQVNTLADLIVAYNTAELDFDLSLGEGGGEERRHRRRRRISLLRTPKISYY
jgi:hypothetical protein